jgi:hypothetical protein
MNYNTMSCATKPTCVEMCILLRHMDTIKKGLGIANENKDFFIYSLLINYVMKETLVNRYVVRGFPIHMEACT